MSSRISKLNDDCSRKIRKGQVITSTLDVVRELVDNAVDAGSQSVKVLLDNYGVKKIEVKDNGHGIAPEEIGHIFQGGYTSKLLDESHLSCGDDYGFRGEALSAICSFSGVVITTKRQKDLAAKKYVINKRGVITAENMVPCGVGTVIVIRDLFKDFPVRMKHALEAKVAKGYLKDIEFYLKCLGICNPLVYFALYHNGSLIWSKPAVKNTEQALTTILGVGLAKHLSKSLTAAVIPENGNENPTWKGQLELFVPQKPVDMKLVGQTNSKWTMIFVNRRAVHIDTYQNLIKRYAIGSSESPTQPDHRKFPLAVCLINVPPSEVDFNRDMNKSKVFLTCKDMILNKLEDMLQSYYGIDLRIIEQENVGEDYENGCWNDRDASLTELENADESAGKSPRSSMQLVNLISSTPEKRQENITTFLGGLKPQSSVSNNSPAPARVTVYRPLTIHDQRKYSNVVSDATVSKRLTNTEVQTKDTGTISPGNYSENEDNVINNENQNRNHTLSSSLSSSSNLCVSNMHENNSSKPLVHLNDIAYPHSPVLSTLDDSFNNISDLYRPEAPQCGAVLHTEARRGHDVHIEFSENEISSKSNRREEVHRETRPKSNNSSFPWERMSVQRLDSPNSSYKRSRMSPENFNENSPSSYQKPAKRVRRALTTIPFSPSITQVSTGPSLRFCQQECQNEKSKDVPISCIETPALLDGPIPPPKRNIFLKPNDIAVALNGDNEGNVHSTPVFGLQASINLQDFLYPHVLQAGKHPHTSNSRIISILDQKADPSRLPLCLVKIEDLIGVFNPEAFQEAFPCVGPVPDGMHQHLGTLNDLLQEFTTLVEEIPSDYAAKTFNILVDLEDMDKELGSRT